MPSLRNSLVIAPALLALALSVTAQESIEERLKRLATEVADIAKREEGTKDRLALLKKRASLSETTIAKLRQDKAALGKELESLGLETSALRSEEDRILSYFRARMKLTYLAGFLTEYRVLFSATSSDELMQANALLNTLTAKDKKKLDELKAVKGKKAAKESEIRSKLSRLDEIEAETASEKARLASEIRQTGELLKSLSMNSAKAKEAFEEAIENAKKMDAYFNDLNFKNRVEMLGKNITLQKGRLQKPVKGKVVQGFGDYVHPRFRTRLPHPGLDFMAPLGTPVQAVFDGEAVFSGWLSGYGYTVILSHPGGVYSLYSHLDRIDAATGDAVKAGQKIGSSGGDPTKDFSGIYFELRQGKYAVDPASWFRE